MPYGLVFNPSLTGLPLGLHGFHIHENASCQPKEKDGKIVAGLAARGHYDPAVAKRHGPPWGDGHLGDLPALYVDTQGNAGNPVLAPRLKLADLKGRSLMVHAGGEPCRPSSATGWWRRTHGLRRNLIKITTTN